MSSTVDVNDEDRYFMRDHIVIIPVTMPKPKPCCTHPGGFRTDDGQWECSRCGHLFASYEAWGAETGNEAAVAAVKGAIEADLREMKETQ